MIRIMGRAVLVLWLSGLAGAPAFAAPPRNPRVDLVTNVGTIELELYPSKAPRTVKNFLEYVRSGFYRGTIFHRVIPGFMIQGGGLTRDMTEKPTRAPIPNEADNGLKNVTGTVAMARTSDPQSATAQFFINTADNAPLDFTSRTDAGWGYCVFGKVIKGMSVVRKIEASPTQTLGPYENVPVRPIVIERASIVGVRPKKRG